MLTAARALTSTTSIALMLCVFISAGCSVTEHGVTYVNATQQALSVTEHGLPLKAMQPGERAIFQEQKSLFPARIRAFSGDQLIHDGIVTWEELEANNFVYVINGTIDPTLGSPIPQDDGH
jgi:hypothetical protein